MPNLPNEPLYLHYLKAARLGRPLNASFELTARCNFNCRFCYIHREGTSAEAEKRRELSTGQWLDMFEEAAGMGVLLALLTGGEPMIRDDFDELYTRLKRLGFSVYINTNGSLIGDEKLRLFRELPPTRINLSIYGASRETYSRVNGNPDGFDLSREAALRLKENGIQTALSMSVGRYNVGDIPAVYDFARDNSFNLAVATYMYPGREDGHIDRLAPEESAEAALLCSKCRYGDAWRPDERSLSELRCPDETAVDDPAEGEGVRCRAGRSSFWITRDGVMTPCGMITSPRADAVKDGLEAAWEKIRLETDEIRTPVKCASCRFKKVCSYCAASCFAETGRFDGVPGYLCERTKKYVELMEKEKEEEKEKA